jgi:hypothetical protein
VISLLLATAVQAATWSTPEPIYSPRPMNEQVYLTDKEDPSADSPQLGFGDDGTAVALVYASYDYACDGESPSHCDYPEMFATAVRRPGAGWAGLSNWVDQVDTPELTVRSDASPLVVDYGTDDDDGIAYFPETVRIQGEVVWRGEPDELGSAIDRHGDGLITWREFDFKHYDPKRSRYYVVRITNGRVSGRRIRTRGETVAGRGSAGDEALAWREGDSVTHARRVPAASSDAP